MGVPAPGRLVLLAVLGTLGLGSLVKLPLESSIALATIYFCRPRRKLSCLRYFPPGPLSLGGCALQEIYKVNSVGQRATLNTQFFSNASAANQNNSFKKCFAACRLNLSSTFSYYVRQSESASIWLILSIKLNLGLLGVRAIKPLFPLQIFRNKVVIVEALFFLITITGTFWNRVSSCARKQNMVVLKILKLNFFYWLNCPFQLPHFFNPLDSKLQTYHFYLVTKILCFKKKKSQAAIFLSIFLASLSHTHSPLPQISVSGATFIGFPVHLLLCAWDQIALSETLAWSEASVCVPHCLEARL